MSETEDRNLLYEIHVERMKEHWGDSFDVHRTPWPKDDAQWRQTGHGAPWDTNVHMARFTLRLYNRLRPIISPEESGGRYE